MPNTAKNKLELYVKNLGPDCLTTDGNVLTCQVCAKVVNAEKKYYVQQHLNGSSHKERLKRVRSRDRRLCLLTNYVELSKKENIFSMDLCQMLIECNIPLYKCQHPSFKRFHEKWSDGHVPDQTALRRNYLRKLYDGTINRIREAVAGTPIWVSLDETTDSKGQYVVNTIIGCLFTDKPSKPFLLGSEIVERTNHASVAQAFTNSLNLLWPSGIHHDSVLLFVSDAAPYMKKAAEGLKILFPKMIHVTCLAHAIHRVCEEIRVSFPDVDGLVANVKKVFLKAPSRLRIFREVAPTLSLPPEPILTRWGTWLKAALYYAVNLEAIVRVLNRFDADEAAAIWRSKELIADPGLKSHLAFISTNFSRLPDCIEKLECSAQFLTTTLGIIEEVRQHLAQTDGPKAQKIRSKLDKILFGNPGLATMKLIQRAIQGESVPAEISTYTVSELAAFTYAPMVSVDVERSFSRYNDLLSDRRYSLTPENLKYHLIPLCNVSEDE